MKNIILSDENFKELIKIDLSFVQEEIRESRKFDEQKIRKELKQQDSVLALEELKIKYADEKEERYTFLLFIYALVVSLAGGLLIYLGYNMGVSLVVAGNVQTVIGLISKIKNFSFNKGADKISKA